MLAWWLKNWPHSINILDIVTKVVPLCTVYQAVILLAQAFTKLTYLNMLCILGQASSKINNMLKKPSKSELR